MSLLQAGDTFPGQTGIDQQARAEGGRFPTQFMSAHGSPKTNGTKHS